MSRMILTLMSLAILSGCQCFEGTRYVSLATARLEALGPSGTAFHPVNPDCCDNCAPCPTLKHKYWACWDDLVTEHTAQRCAFRALHTYWKESGGPISHHFKMGFISAYEDLAMNRKPVPPIIPPPMYWNAYYRSCAGRKHVEDWFAGYDAGLDSGSNSGVSRFHEIYLRRNGCNSGLANGFGNARVDLQNYGQPDSMGGLPDTGGLPNTMPPNIQGMPIPAPSVFGTGNNYTGNPYTGNSYSGSPYGVSNFQGTPDAYGVQMP